MADIVTFERALGEVEYPKPVFQSPLQVVIFMSMCECAQALQHLRQAKANECLVQGILRSSFPGSDLVYQG